MRFSVWPSFQRPWGDVLDLARQVESEGWQVDEHRAYGFELPPPKERVDRVGEYAAAGIDELIVPDFTWAAPPPSAASPTRGSGPRWPPRTGRRARSSGGLTGSR